MILVSACLLGENCRYNGETKPNEFVINYLKDKEYIAFCPECEAGLPIPRLACEIQGGEGQDVLDGKIKIINMKNIDHTKDFIKGAELTLAITKEHNIDTAILKERSPSCGVNYIHTGSFDGNIQKGMGVTARLLHNNGVKLYTEADIESLTKT
ncbi:MAG: DUF523 domain-containing protein [Clostridia bacterium]|nr:DUF523 domain-containing protein [Clostridia bacterium]